MVFQFSNVANTGQYVHFTIYWYQGCLVCDISPPMVRYLHWAVMYSCNANVSKRY